ncbi:hypothetical protein PISMIDRAFT_685351 [Pisolithus microcarpus 441]|uniref:Uncharacterized protein n=1 Tax=Pisolithus microcarpus 441 TaxID=765257 RepID=A0A0C9ZBM6_9AGAM|nr:hypothetical protein BKA83DRAFT_685351 [Pisolithus microcarpus]KIK17323.1 hypothetical protein PISMIDRAFT_685351 [Pisolithus microcarpus 441]
MEQSYGSLAPLLLVLAILAFAALGWCALSSCMGSDILNGLSELWNLFVLSARTSGSSRRRPYGEETWEMEHRRRP